MRLPLHTKDFFFANPVCSLVHFLRECKATVKEDEDEKEKNTSPFTDDEIERIKRLL
jgi:hypothetical protein